MMNAITTKLVATVKAAFAAKVTVIAGVCDLAKAAFFNLETWLFGENHPSHPGDRSRWGQPAYGRKLQPVRCTARSGYVMGGSELGSRMNQQSSSSRGIRS